MTAKRVDALHPAPLQTHRHPWHNRDLPYIALLLLLAALFFSPYWQTSNSVIYPASDLGSDLFSNRWFKLTLIQESLTTEGRLPLWNSHHLGGQPMLGGASSMLPYPPLLLLTSLPISALVMLWWYLHLTVAGIGVYGLLRSGYQFAHWIAFIGALNFMFMPKLIGHLAAGHFDIYAAVVWLPWVIWGVHHAVVRQRWQVLPAAGLVLALQLMAHAQFAYYTAALAGIYGIALGLPTLRTVLRVLAQLTLMFACAALCFAGQLVPLLELLPYAARAALDPAVSNSGALPVPLLATVIAPSDFLYPEWLLYPGVLGVLIAPLALRRRQRLVLFWLAACLFSLIYAIGQTGGIFTLVQAVVPGASLFRVPPRLLIVMNLGVPILLAYALQQLAMMPAPRRWRMGVGLVALGMSMVIVYSLLRGGTAPTHLTFTLPLVAMVLLLPGALRLPRTRPLVLILLTFDIMRFAWQQTTVISLDEALAPPPILDAIDPGSHLFFPFGGTTPTVPPLYGYPLLNAVDPFQLGYSTRAVNLAGGCPRWTIGAQIPECPRFADSLPLNLIAANQVTHIIIPAWIENRLQPVERIGDLLLYRVENPLPRAYVVWQVVDVDSTPLNEVDFAQTAIVDAPQRFALITPANPTATIEIIDSSHDRLELRVNQSHRGLLIIAETWAPGWQAAVDGVQTAVERVNLSQRGIVLEAGQHTVRLAYHPAGEHWSLWVSAASSIIALLLLFSRRPISDFSNDNINYLG
jgi:hypothetical protein